MKKFIYVKLGVMMFMQYMLFAVWWLALGPYISNLGLSAYQVALIISSMAIGSIAAPLVGVIADRYVSSEKLLASLNLLVAVFLLLAATQTSFAGLMVTVTLAMLCYIPSWGLTSSIAMTHISSEQFPRIRILGSIGWVSAGLVSIVAINIFKVPAFDVTPLPLYCGAAAALVTALFNLTLPKTPPTVDKSTKYSIQDMFGLKVLTTLKNKNFNMFILIAFLTAIPFAMFYSFGSIFLNDKGFEYITVTMNWGQFAELFFLFITTSVLIKYGIKKALLFGLSAMLVRYISLYLGVGFEQQWLYYIGILTHGLIFGLFFVAAQVYTDKAVPHEYKAQAQGLLQFVVWGLGIFVGNQITAGMIDNFQVNGQTDWQLMFLIASVATVALITFFYIFFKDTAEQKS